GDCVGCYSQNRQDASLAVISRSFGIVTSSRDLQAAWQRQRNGPRNWHSEKRASRALGTLAVQLNPQHTALVLMNIQPDLYRETSQTSGSSCFLKTLPTIERLLAGARRAGCFVIHALSTPNGDGHWPTPLAGFGPLPGEQLVMCHRSSAFAD